MNCDALAPYYETLEHLSFGRILERARFAFLRDVANTRRAILCGDGDGRFLARFVQTNERVEIDFVDLSARMIGLAEERVARLGPSFRERVTFHQMDVRDFTPQSGVYDLIVTHFFLDCFSERELKDVVARVAGFAAPDARLLVSDFREAQSPLGRAWTRTVIRSLYAAFRVTTGLRVTRLPDYCSALASAGYHSVREQNAAGGLLHSSLWEACRTAPHCRPSATQQMSS